MDENLLKLTQEWNEFSIKFEEKCLTHNQLKESLKKELIYISNDKDEPKKSQLILAFAEKPINTYREASGTLKVESEWGCRLIYTRQHNGSVTCKIKDYDDNDHFIKSYKSPSKITDKKFRKHVDDFFFIDTCSSAIKQPNTLTKIKLQIRTKLSNMSLSAIAEAIIKAIPVIGKIYKVITTKNTNGE